MLAVPALPQPSIDAFPPPPEPPDPAPGESFLTPPPPPAYVVSGPKIVFGAPAPPGPPGPLDLLPVDPVPVAPPPPPPAHIGQLYNEHGGGNRRYNPPAGLKQQEKKQLKDQFNDDVGAISALTLMNPLRKIIDKYFKKPDEKVHNVVRSIFSYVASRTINSSPFVIAKD